MTSLKLALWPSGLPYTFLARPSGHVRRAGSRQLRVCFVLVISIHFVRGELTLGAERSPVLITAGPPSL